MTLRLPIPLEPMRPEQPRWPPYAYGLAYIVFAWVLPALTDDYLLSVAGVHIIIVAVAGIRQAVIVMAESRRHP